MNLSLKNRWDLSCFYSSVDDEQLQKDVNQIIELSKEFKKFKGRLNDALEEVLKLDIKISELQDKVFTYLFLILSTDASNEKVRVIESRLSEQILKETSSCSEYFVIELGKMPDEDYQRQLDNSEILRKHKSYLDQIRKDAKYYLPEDISIALAKRSAFGPGILDELMDEYDTVLKFDNPELSLFGKLKKLFGFGKNLKISFHQILHILSSSKSSSVRKKAMFILNDTLKNPSKDVGGFSYANMRARALNALIGKKIVEDDDRGFTYSMESRNLSNMVDRETVDALHNSVLISGAEQAKRYYKIVAKLIGKDLLLWSDRNAPLPFDCDKDIPYDEALNIVRKATGSFSNVMLQFIDEMVANNKIDSAVYDGKMTGAFNCSLVVPDNKPDSYVLLSYMNKSRDVMTLAHELGHAVHGLLAGKEQGALMQHAPMAYAETASIFNEMVTFEYMLNNTSSDKDKLSLLMNKCSDWINTVVRQISFSFFEQDIHAKRRNGKLTVDDFNSAWINNTVKFYGKDGEVFKYENIDSLWSYVSHFMRPYYVYAYAFGELFTQSLFAVRDRFSKDEFEKLYIDMLKSGSTRNAVELMKPFGLNPNDTDFWNNGINVSIKKWLDEIECLIDKLKL